MGLSVLVEGLIVDGRVRKRPEPALLRNGSAGAPEGCQREADASKCAKLGSGMASESLESAVFIGVIFGPIPQARCIVES